ncbi:hypothetical protein SH139x_003509 [Planctomycetaceae bacterium SH139]
MSTAPFTPLITPQCSLETLRRVWRGQVAIVVAPGVMITCSSACLANVTVSGTRPRRTLINVASMLPCRLMPCAIMQCWHDETAEQVSEQSKMSSRNTHER